MSEIPYYFETPVPKYFRETGWFSNINTILFITWAFSKCSTQSRKVVMDGKEITLAPFEFIAGRLSSPKECHLSEEAFRHQLNTQLKVGLLKKTPNSAPNRFSCYIWVTDRFCKSNPQLNPQPTPNSPPTEPPQSRIKNKRNKESHHPDPSSKKVATDDDRTDDFSKSSIEVVSGIFLSQKELQECISLKGSLELVQDAISYIISSKARTKKITNWPNALETWTIKTNTKNLIPKNEARAKRLEEMYEDERPWSCRYYNDSKKDQKGILFENMNSRGIGDNIFIAFTDLEYDKKVNKTLRDKKMQKSRIVKNNEEF